MYTTDQLVDLGLITKEVANNIKWYCDYCGAPIVNNRTLTQRHCSNDRCVRKLARKAVKVFDMFDLKDIGIETAMKIFIKNPELKFHMDIFGIDLRHFPTSFSTENRQKKLETLRSVKSMSLTEYLKAMIVSNLNEESEKVVEGFFNMEEFYKKNDSLSCMAKFLSERLNRYGKVTTAKEDMAYELLKYKDDIIRCQKYFKIKANVSAIKMDIVITESVKGFRNKKKFVEYCNNQYPGLIKVNLKLNISMSISYCISDGAGGTPKEKYALNPSNGVKLVTSSQFLNELDNYYRILLKGV